MPPPAVQFGEFELDSAAFELRRKGRPVRLERLPLEFLLLLVSRKGELVTRDEIAQKLWGDDVYVDTNTAINVVVRKARQALRDDAEFPKFLLTVPSKGYRFVGALSEEANPPISLEPATVRPVPQIEELPSTLSGARKSNWLRAWMVWAAIGALVLTAFVLGRTYLRPEAKTSGRRIMLAVLPFKNLSGDPNQEYVVDGLTEETITDLGQMSPSQMGVIARTSAMAYKNTEKTVSQIGRELGVDYVLEGSVRSEGGRARVSAQLIRVSDQTHLWAKNYDRNLNDLLEIEDELGSTIAQQVQVNLTPLWQPERARSRTADREAYDLYLKGRFYWNQRSPQAIQESIQYFQQAIHKDPNFALAYAGLADAYNISNIVGLFSAKESLPKAKAAAMKAIELDPSLAESHAALGMVKSHFDFDFSGAEKEFLKAIELNPNSSYAHLFYSNCYLMPVGRQAEAIAENKKALELDPLSLPINNFLGMTYMFSGDYESSYQQFRNTIQMDPTFPLAHAYLFTLLTTMDRYEDAIKEFQKYKILSGATPEEAAAEAEAMLKAYTSGGSQEFWRHNLQEMLRALNGTRARRPAASDIAGAYAMAGDKDKAFQWLDRAYEEREGQNITLLKVDPAFKNLRGDPRYVAMLQKLGLPE